VQQLLALQSGLQNGLQQLSTLAQSGQLTQAQLAAVQQEQAAYQSTLQQVNRALQNANSSAAGNRRRSGR
jgi:hypothetical protein